MGVGGWSGGEWFGGGVGWGGGGPGGQYCRVSPPTHPPTHPPTQPPTHQPTHPSTNTQVGLDLYPEWIGLVADFTISSLTSWRWASGSVYYLLGLWSRLVSSVPYLKGDAPSQLDTYVPR